MEKTGEILEKYIRREMTQVELSQIIDVSPQYISNIVNNLKSPSEKFLEKFYSIFNVTEEDKRKICEYEEFRKLPKKIQDEIKFLRENIQSKDREIISGSSKVLLKGELLEGGKLFINEGKEYHLFPRLNNENPEEGSLFSLIIKCKDYSPLFIEGDILIFQKHKGIDFSVLHKSRCLVEYENRKIIADIRYSDEVFLIQELDGEDIWLLPKDRYYKVKIIGVLKGTFRCFK